MASPKSHIHSAMTIQSKDLDRVSAGQAHDGPVQATQFVQVWENQTQVCISKTQLEQYK